MTRRFFHKPLWPDNRGFSIAELMAVVAIVGVMAAIAVPSFLSAMPNLHIKSAVRDRAGYMRLARAKAVSERAPYGVYLDDGTDEFYLFADLDGNGLLSEPDSVVVGPVELEDGVSYVSCTFPNNTVVFNPDGSASASGQIDMQKSEGGLGVYSIDVLASTGRVRVTAP